MSHIVLLFFDISSSLKYHSSSFVTSISISTVYKSPNKDKLEKAILRAIE